MIGMKQIQCVLIAMALAATMASPVSVSAAKSTKKKTEATTTEKKKKTEDKTEKTTTEATTEATTADTRTKERVTYTMSDIDITGQSAIVIDIKTGEVLYRKNETKKQYPSSITKLMTAIIAYENMELDDPVHYTEQIINAVPEGDLTAGLKKNERLTVKQSMNLLLLYSANDAAYGLAYECSGGMDAFAELMNEKASELGCKTTHFTNSTGDYVKGQYTTASDMALIAKEAYNIKAIRTILKTKKYTIASTNKHSKKQKWKNSNRMLDKDSEYYYAKCIGGRTGVYEGSGKKGDTDFSTIVSYAKLQGRAVCAVILNDSDVKASYTDATNLFTYIDTHANLSVYEKPATTAATEKATKATKSSAKKSTKKATTAAKKTSGNAASRVILVAKIAGVVIAVLLLLVIIRIISSRNAQSRGRRRAEKERKARLKRQRKKNRRRR